MESMEVGYWRRALENLTDHRVLGPEARSLLGQMEQPWFVRPSNAKERRLRSSVASRAKYFVEDSVHVLARDGDAGGA